MRLLMNRILKVETLKRNNKNDRLSEPLNQNEKIDVRVILKESSVPSN